VQNQPYHNGSFGKNKSSIGKIEI